MAGHGQERRLSKYSNHMAESMIAGSSGRIPLLGLSLIPQSSQLDGEEEEYSTGENRPSMHTASF